jgi:hypothetical protein
MRMREPYIEGVATHDGVAIHDGPESCAGKLDARGRDEATWTIERRVDILLAE